MCYFRLLSILRKNRGLLIPWKLNEKVNELSINYLIICIATPRLSNYVHTLKVWTNNSDLVSCVFPLAAKEPDKPITVVYVPSHLYHMVFELFKVVASFSFHSISADLHPLTPATAALQNAMRATMEQHGDALHYPPIQAQVALGNEDLTVKVRVRPPGSDYLCCLLFRHPLRPVLSRWATAAVACRCVRSTGCSLTPTPRHRGPAWTAPALPLWSVPSLLKQTSSQNDKICLLTGLLNCYTGKF